mmetsp:Transcript_10820/g.22059  ORF Transcript_10820/g.22059 Transcript_10820/m.22059 type:complete len:200 (+) Transcript_10820:1291-1890(+)
MKTVENHGQSIMLRTQFGSIGCWKPRLKTFEVRTTTVILFIVRMESFKFSLSAVGCCRVCHFVCPRRRPTTTTTTMTMMRTPLERTTRIQSRFRKRIISQTATPPRVDLATENAEIPPTPATSATLPETKRTKPLPYSILPYPRQPRRRPRPRHRRRHLPSFSHPCSSPSHCSRSSSNALWQTRSPFENGRGFEGPSRG